MEPNAYEPSDKTYAQLMGKQHYLKGTLSEDVNKGFRIQTRLYHIFHKHTDAKKYPVIINNFNRLEYLEAQIDWLLRSGHTNLHIIDNASDYEPLLRFYKKVKATVYRLDRNVGHEAFWKTHLHQRFGRYYHVYTDPDLLPDADTPPDFMAYFKSLLDQHVDIQKVGFGLKIDDLPDYYPNKEKVISWESGLLKKERTPGVFEADIDTTFALYRPGAFMQSWGKALRTGAPYMLRHMPWYEHPEKSSEESLNYMKTAGNASSWYKTLTGEDKRYDG
jgi:hypothetical protein